MNAEDILKYGQLTVLESVNGLDETQWLRPDALGIWSVKDIIAHLASFEQVLVEGLAWILQDRSDTPGLDRLVQEPEQFNLEEVARRKYQSPTQALAELQLAHEAALDLWRRIPIESRRQPGILPSYGAKYDLEDLLVYSYYGHKREHSAHIGLFRDRLAQETDLRSP